MPFSFLPVCSSAKLLCGRNLDENKEHLAVMNCEAKWPMSAMNDRQPAELLKTTPPRSLRKALSATLQLGGLNDVIL